MGRISADEEMNGKTSSAEMRIRPVKPGPRYGSNPG
jgi:hypothetical protein